MRSIYWHAGSWDEYTRLQEDKAALRRVNKLIKDIQRNGYGCSLGKPEMFKEDPWGLCGVRECAGSIRRTG